MAEGIEVRKHAKGTSYRASVWDAHRERRIRKTFPTLAAAKAWRTDAHKALRTGANLTPSKLTVDQAVEEWLQGARDGTIRTRGRQPFKPGTIRVVERNQRRLSDEFGTRALSSLRLTELQDYVDRLDRKGMNANSTGATILALRLVCRRAKSRGLIDVNPTDGLELPARGSGDRLPPAPKSVAALLAALSRVEDRALWATAMFAGLRRGELMGLRWEDVDLPASVLHVERSYDIEDGVFQSPKSKRGVRTVPIVGALAPYLRDHMVRCGRREGLVWGREGADGGLAPFNASTVQARCDNAWKGLERVTLHQCRHLYASMSIAAGVNAHALSKYMGHASITITLDRYGHLLPGNESEAASLLDAYLERELAV